MYDQELGLFIAGRWRAGGGGATLPVVDPATCETVAQVPCATPADLNEALDAAGRAFPAWKGPPPRNVGRSFTGRPSSSTGAVRRSRER